MRPILRTILMSAAIAIPGATVSLAPSSVFAAGPNSEEIWFGTGQDSLETDENGQLTAEGAKTRSTEIDRIPGEDDWELKVHARMGKYAAPGPLYVQFYGSVNGKEYLAHQHEDLDYDGSRLYTSVILLESNIGFNKDREYRVQIVQNNGKRDIVIARGKIKLIDTGREAPEAEDEGGVALARLTPAKLAKLGRKVPGSRRALVIHPEQVELARAPAVDGLDPGLELRFVLPPGSYATVLIREVCG